MEDDCKHAANLPCDPHSFGLFTFRPDEVEEEGCSEDEGNKDTSEDVVGRCADIVVIVYLEPLVGDLLDFCLSVDIVYSA